MKKKATARVIIGASLAAVAGAYFSYTRGQWPFKSVPACSAADIERKRKAATASVDVALTNEVASHTQHNPNNAASFTDDGATGNAD
ncbi:hypothetical protein KBK19_15800 [Microvirga sp. STR05]|uniref:Uncharacterized protein n=1 Tax=Hymenobacter duratus TaxID=2771356 RepID=A0ABR8JLK9_9BACT|nr:hypothetical protein [Hymenobacter duratus]MBD2716506.1 hypothetical protein [Hymenobacter duratus]MBR7951421.1 hypothetical protein [Microvirga sp. STR05]